MPGIFSIPLLSLLNGPSALPHAVETLQSLRIPLTHARFLPVIGYSADPEVLPYYRFSPRDEDKRVDAAKLTFCLHVNIREDHRLQRFLPLVATGLASQAEVSEWRRNSRTSAEGYQSVYPRLDDAQPDWTNLETPSERLARQLCTLFPELRQSRTPLIKPSDRILVAFQNRLEPRIRSGAHTESPLLPEDIPDGLALELVQLFVTRGLIAIATCDMLGGFRYILPIEPQARDIDFTVSPESDLDHIAHNAALWLEAYPHRAIAPVVYEEPEQREKEEWAAFYERHPERDNIFDRAPRLRTDEDPAIRDLSRQIQEQFEDGRTEDLTSEEMLSLAQIHLPEYIPHYPRQFAISGGLTLEGIVLSLMERWIAGGMFLGIGTEEWGLFGPVQRVALLAILLQRRACQDLCGLFGIAVQKLIDASIEVWIDEYHFMPVRLGGPLAQPGRTLVLGGVSALHRPEVVVKVPKDRSNMEESPAIEAQLDVLARLFLPAHVPFRVIWEVDRPVLGRSAYLAGPVGGGRRALGLARLNDT